LTKKTREKGRGNLSAGGGGRQKILRGGQDTYAKKRKGGQLARPEGRLLWAKERSGKLGEGGGELFMEKVAKKGKSLLFCTEKMVFMLGKKVR